jgi:4-amino-4-deoxy-L-arabinose transferase-like glycosyltransferase
VFDLGGYPLLDPDEGRNAEVAREMARTDDYVVPRLNGLPYLDKPVLYYAAAAASIELLGPTETAARIPSLLFTVATVVLVGWFATRLYGPDGGAVAAAAAASTPFALAYARTVIFDSALTFFVVLALIGFYCAIEGRAAHRARGTEHGARDTSPPRAMGPRARINPAWAWTSLAWAAMALGVLTKGPVALAVPLLVALPYAGWRRAWRAVADATSVLLFAALLGPWLLAMSREVPGFLQYALVTETALRLTTHQLQRVEPFWYFLAIFPAAALPWSVVAVAAWRGRPDPRAVFLLLWIAVPLLFFTLSQSKRPQYVLPLVHAVALLVAGHWARAARGAPGARAGAVALAVLGAGLLVGHRLIAGAVDATAAIAAEIPATAWGLGAACVAGAALAWLGAVRRREVALLGLVLPVAAIPFVSRGLMDEIGRERSAAELAAAVERVLDSDAEVVGVAAFPLSLPFYLQRPLVLATDDGAELTSNYLIRHLDQWRRAPGTPLRPLAWWMDALVTCGRRRVFVVRSEDAGVRRVLEGVVPLLVDTGRYAAYGPCGAGGFARAG